MYDTCCTWFLLESLGLGLVLATTALEDSPSPRVESLSVDLPEIVFQGSSSVCHLEAKIILKCNFMSFISTVKPHSNNVIGTIKITL